MQGSQTYILVDLKNSFDIKAPWPEVDSQKYEQYILEPYLKVHKTYPDYLSSLKTETQKDIKTQWKEINQTGEIKLSRCRVAEWRWRPNRSPRSSSE